VSELVDGIALEALIGEVTVPEPKLRALIRRLALALKHAHEMGVVHRRLSPLHILIPGGRLEECKLVDFDLSEYGDAAALRPYGLYAAPEQKGRLGGEVGPWTDVFSLGRVILALASGDRPDESASTVRRGVPIPRDMPSTLRSLFSGMLADGPKDADSGHGRSPIGPRTQGSAGNPQARPSKGIEARASACSVKAFSERPLYAATLVSAFGA
jgi:serine/threonine-protein kinase